MIKTAVKKYSIMLSEQELDLIRQTLKLLYDIKETIDQETTEEYEITIDNIESIKSLVDYGNYIYKSAKKRD